MVEKYIEMKFNHAYNLAGGLREKILQNHDEEYIIGFFDLDNITFQRDILKPNKQSILHDFISEAYTSDIEYFEKKMDYELVVNDFECLLSDYNIEYSEKDINPETEIYTEYLLCKIKNHVVQLVSNETFQLLFSDRMFCLKFNSIISEKIKLLKKVNYPDLLVKDGKLVRCTYFPTWVQKAIFLRDKGCCAICLNDLSGLLKTDFHNAIDHIVPLNLGGINDISNFQLLCRTCNLEKLGHTIKTSEYYPTYF